MCLADLASSFISKKAVDVPIENYYYLKILINIDDVELNPDIIALKNDLGEMWRSGRPCMIHFDSFQDEKSRRESQSFIVMHSLGQ